MIARRIATTLLFLQGTLLGGNAAVVDTFLPDIERISANNLLYGVGYRRTCDRFGEAPEFAIITSPHCIARRPMAFRGARRADVIQVNASYSYLAVNARTTEGGNDSYGLPARAPRARWSAPRAWS